MVVQQGTSSWTVANADSQQQNPQEQQQSPHFMKHCQEYDTNSVRATSVVVTDAPAVRCNVVVPSSASLVDSQTQVEWVCAREVSFFKSNQCIWTSNSCKCTVNDYHCSYSSLVLLQQFFKQNGFKRVLRRAKVWMCHNIMCTLPTLFIFVAMYLCQYSNWATCWLMAETGFSSWWYKDFSCQHCVHPAFCPVVSEAFIFLWS